MLLYGGSKQCFKKVWFIMARKSTVIDQVVFVASVKEAENNGALKNLGELYDAIARIYTMAVIALGSTVYCTPALAKKWVEEWEIVTLTSPGRKGRPGKESFISYKLSEAQRMGTDLMNLIPEEMTDLRTDFQYLLTFLSLQPGETINDETGEVIKPVVSESVSDETIVDETLEPIMPEQSSDERLAA